MFVAKTVIKALNKAKDAVGEEFAPDKEIWSQRIFRIQEGFQTKWQKVMDKFAKKGEKDAEKDRNNNSTCDNKSKPKDKNKKKSEFKPDKKTKNKKNKQVCSTFIFFSNNCSIDLLIFQRHCETFRNQSYVIFFRNNSPGIFGPSQISTFLLIR